MKKYLEILQNNFFIVMNLSVLFLYLLFFYLEKQTGFSFPLNAIGIAFVVFLTPYNFLRIFKKRFFPPSFSNIEKYLAYLTIFFFLFVPLFFFLNKIFGYSLSLENIMLINLSVFALSLLVAGDKNISPKEILPKKEFFTKHWPLILGLVLFVFLHLINFHFYKFVPEWDGYSDMIKTEEMLESGDISVEYRSFFISSVGILSAFSKTDPYQIFSFWFIILQTTLLFVLYELLKIHGVKNKMTQFFVLLGALSVPVLNMEIDMIRPQNITIAFLPVFIFFLYRAISQKSAFFWSLSFLICAFGLNYHEFFTFFFVIFFGFLLFHLFKKFLFESKDKKDKLILALILITLILLFLLSNQYIKSLPFIWHIIKSIATNIVNVENWRWWFLGNYNTDGPDLQLGWPGIGGAVQYYGYYLSPFVLFVLLANLYFFLKNKYVWKNTLPLIITPLFLVMFAFAEIFPRLNFVFLPERFWVFIGILTLLSLVPLIQNFEKTSLDKNSKKIIASLGIFCLTLGIGGSFFVAKNKMALTAKEEIPVIEWIKENTPEDSIFITQGSNGPLVRYFSKREALSPSKEFFLSEKIEPCPIEAGLEILNKVKQEKIEKISSELNLISIEEEIEKENLEKLFEDLKNDLISYKKIEERVSKKEKTIETPLYVLYSNNKFSSIYAKREWWRNSNFYGANLEKFNDAFELVYNENNVKIWKVR
jgi:hypothetical protein